MKLVSRQADIAGIVGIAQGVLGFYVAFDDWMARGGMVGKELAFEWGVVGNESLSLRYPNPQLSTAVHDQLDLSIVLNDS